MDTALVALPLPFLTLVLSVVALVLVARVDLARPPARVAFVAFFALMALGTLLTGLRFGYGIDTFRPLQRTVPLFAGPLLYLGFSAFAVPDDALRRRAALHIGFAFFLALFAPMVLAPLNAMDAVIGLSYLTYAVLLLGLWWRGANALSLARIAQAATLRRWLLYAAAFLLISFAIDAAIAVNFALSRVDDAMQLISYGSLAMIAALLVGIVTYSTRPASTAPAAVSPVSHPDTDGVTSAAHALLEETRLYLDTDLTVDRLAKRLRIPTRTLSAAINQSEGVNVSQFVNGYRLDHAARLLSETDTSVTKIAEQSGFLTRSNFYREFQKRHDMTPAAYRTARKTATNKSV